MCSRVDERSSDSYSGRDDFFCFFFRKSLKICFGSIFFRGLIFFKFSSFPLLNGRQAPSSNSKSVKIKKDVIKFCANGI